MTFSTLAGYFEKLEATSKRLELTSILSELFKKSDSAEIAKICYLIQARVAPFFEPIEIGMAEMTIAAAVARAFNKDKAEVVKLYRQKGNFGLAAQKLAEKVKVKTKSAKSVSEVFDDLLKIAKFTGKGTVEQKVSTLAGLLQKLDPVSVKHIINIPLGTLRLGIGDPTAMDALSLAKNGDKSLRPFLEDAYNKTSDLGYVAQIYFKNGAAGLKNIKLIVGKPVRPALAERLPNAHEAVKRLGSEFAAEPKFDGFRCIGGLTPIFVKGKGHMPVKDVKVDELVLSHTGEFKRVTAKNVRLIEKSERLFYIQSYFGHKFKISGDHKILIYRNGETNWIPVQEIKRGDLFVFPIPKLEKDSSVQKEMVLQSISGYKKTFKLNNPFFRFLGFWIGDGFSNNYHNTERIGLTFTEVREKELAEYYKRLVAKEFQISQISTYVHQGAINIYWRDGPFRHWLTQNFRREWSGKMLPPWFINVSKDEFDQFLKGWVESDGTSRHGGGFRITTKEPDLALFAQILSLSFGKMVGFRKIRVMNKNYYELIIPGTQHLVRVNNGKYLISIQKIEEVKRPDPRQRLYNLQVENDESYCVPMAVLHNCQIHKSSGGVQIYSRNLENTTHAFPDIVEGIKKEVRTKSAILEGEAIAYNPQTQEFLPFQETTKRRRKYKIDEMAKLLPLVLFAFDLLYLDGRDITQKPYKERRKLLESIIPQGGQLVRLAEHRVLYKAEQINKFFNEAIAEGLEGLMLKKLQSPYVAGGRGFHWIKFKRSQSGELTDTVDCVLLGVYAGRGKRTEFGVGGLLVGVYDKKKDEFATISRIGTGLTDEEFRKVNNIAQKLKLKHKPSRVNAKIEPSFWIEPKVVLEILADEITRSPVHTAGWDEKTGSGFALRFPRLLKFREADKRAEDATTVAEIEKMYRRQFKKQPINP